MEDALAHSFSVYYIKYFKVLILVVMEDALALMVNLSTNSR